MLKHRLFVFISLPIIHFHFEMTFPFENVKTRGKIVRIFPSITGDGTLQETTKWNYWNYYLSFCSSLPYFKNIGYTWFSQHLHNNQNIVSIYEVFCLLDKTWKYKDKNKPRTSIQKDVSFRYFVLLTYCIIFTLSSYFESLYSFGPFFIYTTNSINELPVVNYL